MADLIQVKNLQTSFFTPEGEVRAIDGVSFDISEGKTLGLVGESGCGKSVTSLSIMRLIQSPPGKIVGGEISYREYQHRWLLTYILSATNRCAVKRSSRRRTARAYDRQPCVAADRSDTRPVGVCQSCSLRLHTGAAPGLCGPDIEAAERGAEQHHSPGAEWSAPP